MNRMPELNPAAFLFDLDGTLIDSEMLWVKAIVGWLADNGISAEEKGIAVLVFGHSWPDIHATLHQRFPSLPRRTADEVAIELRAHYSRLSARPEDIIIRSSVELYRAAAKIAPCAIVSGSPRADVAAAAKLCGIADVTAFVIGAEDYACGKPAPDGYLLAAHRLNVDPARCIVVEDSTAGVRSGLAAGMNVIGLDRNRIVPQDFTGCLFTVNELTIQLAERVTRHAP